jgi:N-methylhydantoinase B
LLVLDATVVLRAQGGVRELPLDAFILGSRRTARRPDELVTAIRCPLPPADARSRFLKLGARAYLVISIAMVAGLAACDRAGRIIDLRLAVGACAPVAVRLRQLERRLVGQPLAAAAGCVGADDLAGLAPIDDVRASAAYRRDAALVLVRRILAGLAAEQPVTVAA